MAETKTETRTLLPEVQAYVTAKAEAERTHDAAFEEAQKKYPHRRGWDRRAVEERTAFDAATDAARATRADARREAWHQLKDSSNPLVRWIEENCIDYREEAETVLRALPATAEELDALAEQYDWCSAWDSLREQAIDAGALPGAKPRGPAYRAALDVIEAASCCGMSGAGRRRVRTALDALVAEAKAETPQAVAA